MYNVENFAERSPSVRDGASSVATLAKLNPIGAGLTRPDHWAESLSRCGAIALGVDRDAALNIRESTMIRDFLLVLFSGAVWSIDDG